MVSEGAPARAGLNDRALELAEKSATFRGGLPSLASEALAHPERAMNWHCSNLIEAHDADPIDIERAMQGAYSTDPKKRNLQLEAKAHVAVQKWIDEDGMPEPPTAPASILVLHHLFRGLLPPELLFVENPKTGEKSGCAGRAAYGLRRTRAARCISLGAIPRFLERMYEAYSLPGRIKPTLAAACAHHRLLWLHPFHDGDVRVSGSVGQYLNDLFSDDLMRDSIGTCVD